MHVEKLREAIELLEAKLPQGIRVESDLRAGQAAVLGDATQVHQVMMNLDAQRGTGDAWPEAPCPCR